MPVLADILGALAAKGLTVVGRRALPQTSGALRLPGLSAPVEIIRDRWGVPHIYARNVCDLMFGQGFVHAQDRLWQMDFQRRLIAGRLSEVLGGATLATDRWLRILGLRRVAEQEAAALEDGILAYFRSFVAGVNAVITQGPLPVEFTLLHYRPEPWTLTDTMSWGKLIMWGSSVNWESELLRAQLVARLGPERAAELEPDCADLGPCIAQAGIEYGTIGAQAQAQVAEARPAAGPPAQDGLGSNAWVVAGSRAAGGSPLLANDLHQLMNTPAIWYENHLEGGDIRFIGCSLPGAPGLVVGHNGRVAWGVSNGFPDVQDLYVEHLRRHDGRIQYEYQGEWHDAQVAHEVIRVRGRQPVIEDVVITRHGPIINGLAPDLAGEQPLALRWTSHEPDTLAQFYDRLFRVRDCLHMREILRGYSGPNQNFCYADTEGNIAYSYAGRLPIRAQGDGRAPVPGWTGEYEWTGYVPYDELPHLYNPALGYVATANNRVVDGDYPYHISCDFCSADRARRICELIEAAEAIDMAYMQRMQLDQVSAGARNIARRLAGLQPAEPELAAACTLMADWDGEMRVDSPAATLHLAFSSRLLRLLLARPLGGLADHYFGLGANPILADGSLLGFRAWEWLQQVLAQPDSPWYDRGSGETRDEVVLQALREAVAELKQTLGPDLGDWAWGKTHRLTYSHILSRVKPLAPFFNRGPFPVGGDYTTVCATGNTQHQDTEGAIVGPNYRFIADLGNLRRSQSLLVPGQSGRPTSPHYDDQIHAWFAGEMHPMLWDREDVLREAAETLQLDPA